ncbi:tyrosine-type recombinase/integrase [Pseudonocardia sp. RS010]|uniref:tyrosine-type recombinase/integrase n=1 Tax=Pseudonocardia sp. RS010 TaxID=3385979 RepID=UPI0039A2C9A7
MVYAGTDPVSGKRHYLRETIPAGPKAEAEADKALRRLANQVDEQRNPRTSATLNQLLDRYLDVLDVGPSTQQMYTKYLEKHVRPFLGKVKAGAIDPDALDSLYAELRRCRIHCRTKGLVDHRTPREHECDERCRPHAGKPLAPATVRHIHFVLHSAFEKAVRWRWVSFNPVSLASPPAAGKPDPQPPTTAECARILDEAWREPDWGALVWLTMTTGARRGEICALRWNQVDLDAGMLTYRRAIAQYGTELVEKPTKTHQQRRVTLDTETVAALTEHRERAAERARLLGIDLPADAFVFSLAPDSSEPLVPGSVSQRYSRMATRLGIDTHLHSLRHYSATELIAAGVDVRTVAGRLGHSGGGTTTLRVYAAWLAEADQRAATGLSTRLPARPASSTADERAMADPRTPREDLAVARRDVLAGLYPPGSHLPGMKVLARERGLSVSTVHRAFKLLREWGVVEGDESQQPVVTAAIVAEQTAVPAAETQEAPAQLLKFELRRGSETLSAFSTIADPDSASDLERVLRGAHRRIGFAEDILNCELRVVRNGREFLTFVLL